MTRHNKKLHLNIKGKVRNHLYKVLTHIKAKALGLKAHKIEFNRKGHAEIVVQGYMGNLWKMVDFVKTTGFVFVHVEEITFRFAD